MAEVSNYHVTKDYRVLNHSRHFNPKIQLDKKPLCYEGHFECTFECIRMYQQPTWVVYMCTWPRPGGCQSIERCSGGEGEEEQINLLLKRISWELANYIRRSGEEASSGFGGFHMGRPQRRGSRNAANLRINCTAWGHRMAHRK